jgi:homoserine O-acetyltransferase
VPRATSRASLILLALSVWSVAGCRHPVSLLNPADPHFAVTAPDSFDVHIVTTKGNIVVRLRRWWSPHGVDRFYTLVRNRYYDDVAFHRTIRNFVAQFGIHGNPAVSAAWRGKTIPDDTVRVVNQRGTLSFARGGPNSRSVQLYFNTVDNTPRLDTLNGFGFPPVGQVIAGLDVLDRLNWEYSGTRGGQTFPGPSQDSITTQGNAWLRHAFPRLDYIVTARVVREWRRRRSR